ncbi:MAG TPA: SAM-dependent chlorinase/fluorinase [Myxococcota bacterium]|nr:SAM-dependent chlorinase/fluorinase [Myxococcota bacterium]HRY92747.1 SAM-dependent chlorinase/fluorinase [Myxococcota bacterium]
MRAGPPLVSLLSDFGTRDTYVGQMKAVLLGLCPRARLVDLTHEVPAGDVLAGALALVDALAACPRGCIHLAVVDPGVGLERRALALFAPGATFVGPDNGLLWPAFQAALGGAPGQARQISAPEVLRASPAPTFHGRDVFAPAAAHLALGRPPAALGPPVPLGSLVRLELPPPRATADGLLGQVLGVDRFGNCLTSLDAAALAGLDGSRGLRVLAAGRDLGPPRRTYGEVPPGQALALIGSSGRLELAVRNGSAAASLGLAPGDPVELRRGGTRA